MRRGEGGNFSHTRHFDPEEIRVLDIVQYEGRSQIVLRGLDLDVVELDAFHVPDIEAVRGHVAEVDHRTRRLPTGCLCAPAALSAQARLCASGTQRPPGPRTLGRGGATNIVGSGYVSSYSGGWNAASSLGSAALVQNLDIADLHVFDLVARNPADDRAQLRATEFEHTRLLMITRFNVPTGVPSGPRIRFPAAGRWAR